LCKISIISFLEVNNYAIAIATCSLSYPEEINFHTEEIILISNAKIQIICQIINDFSCQNSNFQSCPMNKTKNISLNFVILFQFELALRLLYKANGQWSNRLKAQENYSYCF